MDIKSYLKSVSLPALLDARAAVEDEIKLRETRGKKVKKVVTYSDGAARGNPGPAGIGVLIYGPGEEKVLQDYRYIGETTNNEAEYRALLLALDNALEITQDSVDCFMDSELLVRQMNGQYAIRSEKLLKFHNEVKHRMTRFKSITFNHVPREHPQLRLVDKLANRAIDEHNQEKKDIPG